MSNFDSNQSSSIQCHQPLDILYPRDFFGCIMGEKGQKIIELKQRLGLRISSEKEQSRNGYRLMHIEGEWANQWQAFCEIANTIENADDRDNSDSANDLNSTKKSPPPLFTPDNELREYTVQFRIPARVTGSLIGKGGAQLNELRDNFKDAEIHVTNVNDKSDPNFRYLSIKASHCTFIELSEALSELLEKVFLLGPNMGSNTSQRTTGPGNRTMYANGNNSTSDGRSEQDTKRRRLSYGDNFNSRGSPIGAFNNNGQSMSTIQNVNNNNTYGVFSRKPGNTMNGNVNNDSMIQNNFNHIQSNQNTQSVTSRNTQSVTSNTVVTMNDASCGKVIGPGGSTIKNIRASTGCSIITDKKGDRNDGNREIRVEGNLNEVTSALNIINNCINGIM